MVYEKKGDIFQTTSGIIVHGCNAMGVMGAGVAKLVKEKYPAAYKSYIHYCDSSRKKGYPIMGTVQMIPVNHDLIIANAITQTIPGPFAEEDAIYKSLKTVFETAKNLNKPIHSVKIGCGIGGLRWIEVRDIFSILQEQYPDVNCVVWSL